MHITEDVDMAAKFSLNSNERRFFSLVGEAVLTNPFTKRREQLNAKMSLLPRNHSEMEHKVSAIAETRKWVEQLEKSNRDNFNLYADRDRQLLRKVFLWDFFHYFIEPFDKHIHEQIKADSGPLKVEFADEAFSYLQRKGFDREESMRYFSLNFQLRRAYYFILHGLVGRSICMKKLRESLWNNIFTYDIEFYDAYLWNRMENFSTILLGETGTGKGTAAMAIGRSGFIPFDMRRKCFKESFTRSFITLNLSQFPESIIESELFGHRKGSFSGAVDNHQGIFQHCSAYGSIFLDEIGEVSVPIQIKLLKVIEERAFTPVGSHETRRFEGRVIAATNRSLPQLRDTKIMRQDFFYRLCSDIIVVPSLRERIGQDEGELDDLLEIIIRNMLGKGVPEIVDRIRDKILQEVGLGYEWAGNVRELAQCVRSFLLKNSYQPNRKSSSPKSEFSEKIDNRNLGAQELVKRYCHKLYKRHGTYGEVARITRLDRRTVKKHINDWMKYDNE